MNNVYWMAAKKKKKKEIQYIFLFFVVTCDNFIMDINYAAVYAFLVRTERFRRMKLTGNIAEIEFQG